MKNLIKFTFALSVVILLSSCEDKEDPIGQWDDNIHLSTKSVSFKATTDSVTITTKGDWWWIDGITLNDSINYSYYNNETIDLESESYIIEEDAFIVQRRDKNTLFIQMPANGSNTQQKLRVFLEAGDYFDSVVVIQDATE